MRPSLTLLLVLTLLPNAAAANLETVALEPREAPAEMEIVALGQSRAVDAPAPPAKAALPARVPHARAPAQDLRAEDENAAMGGARATTEGGDVASPETLRASMYVVALEGAGIPLGDIGLRVRSDGAALVPLDAPPMRRDEAARREFEALGGGAAGALAPGARAPQPALSFAPGGSPGAEGAPTLPRARSGAPTQPGSVASAESGAATSWAGVAALAAGALALLLLPFALYHRLRGARALENATRGKLAALLRDRPGLTPADAARELGIDPSTARYHLCRLAGEGLAVTQGTGARPRYFAPGSARPDERSALVAAHDSAHVLDAVRHAPGLPQTEYARGLGIGRSTLRWHLRRLEAARLVRFEREGRVVKVRPA